MRLVNQVGSALLWTGLGVCVAFAAAGCRSTGRAPSEQYRHKRTRELVAFVRSAAKLVEQKGDKAFPEFRSKGGKWFREKEGLYVFVLTMGGFEPVNAAFPECEGKNMLWLKDKWGKPLVRDLIAEVSEYGDARDGWTHYQWQRPGETKPTWKTSYVVRATAPSGVDYVVGAGLYDLPMEPEFAVDEVKEAKALIAKKGKAAFPLIRSKTNRFFFKDTYVFVTDVHGIELVNPAFPELEGTDIWDLKDLKGQYPARDYIALAVVQGKGWVSYYFPKPGKTKPSLKYTYVEGVKIDGELYVVGCGIYLD